MIWEPLAMEITAEDFSEAGGTRSPGLHLSQILSELDLVRSGGPRYPATDNATRQLYFSMGLELERYVALYSSSV